MLMCFEPNEEGRLEAIEGGYEYDHADEITDDFGSEYIVEYYRGVFFCYADERGEERLEVVVVDTEVAMKRHGVGHTDAELTEWVNGLKRPR